MDNALSDEKLDKKPTSLEKPEVIAMALLEEVLTPSPNTDPTIHYAYSNAQSITNTIPPENSDQDVSRNMEYAVMYVPTHSSDSTLQHNVYTTTEISN
eukprot:3958356-Ditylum_brightwellii.AAC.1